MAPGRRAIVLAMAWILAGAGCTEPPPAEDPPEPKPEPPPPPPPPKPTCKAMKDRCKADEDTVVPIPGSGYAFTPPLEWEYAMLEEATVTQQSDEGAVLLLQGHDPPKSYIKARKARWELAKSMAELVEVKAPSRMTWLNGQNRKLGGLRMTLWEREAKRGDRSGAFLVLTVKTGKQEILGIGFAPEGDIDGTKAILAALKTFKEAPADEGEDGEGSDKKGSAKKGSAKKGSAKKGKDKGKKK